MDFTLLLNDTNPMDGIVTAITGMATTVQTSALSVIEGVLPVLAVVIAAVIVATLGVKMVRRFAK